ncbi:hypothetical protein [Tenacibaculum maritimum]|uniref:hypothetical protein n=1 Tax=Tenacibaculum maritimum TaxID=107401 RepID=UPI003875C14D
MLRLYTPIKHDIFTLHKLLENVVCEVWCNANNDNCDDKLEQAFKDIYHYSYKSTPKVKKNLKDEVERIYEIFKGLNQATKDNVRTAFKTNNNIESLCNGTSPVYLSALPDVVKNDIKPLFKWCYEELLEKGKVAGDKMDYYNELINDPNNDFDTCPCCGLTDIESAESICREDFDHYLPKKEYPFASVNFLNLVPICNKCNRDRKKAKDPIENDRIAYYPFSSEPHTIECSYTFNVDIDSKTKQVNLDKLSISFTGNVPKTETWNWLFAIEDRYNDYLKSKAKSWLRELATRFEKNNKRGQGLSYLEIINDDIEIYEDDKYSEKKFLKIAFLKAIKNDAEFMSVYE